MTETAADRALTETADQRAHRHHARNLASGALPALERLAAGETLTRDEQLDLRAVLLTLADDLGWTAYAGDCP